MRSPVLLLLVLVPACHSPGQPDGVASERFELSAPGLLDGDSVPEALDGEGPSDADLAACDDLACPEGTRCQVLLDEHGLPDPRCVEAAPEAALESCSTASCGAAATCEMAEVCPPGGPCALAPTCVPLACDEAAPTGGCDAACATGYLMEGGSPTCSCCSPVDEPTPTLCLVDATCGGAEVCSHAGGCADACRPGQTCAAVCWGRCTHDDLVLHPAAPPAG